MLITSPFLPSINSRSGHLLLKLPITSTRTFYSQWKGSGVTSYQRVKESENIAPLWRKPLEKNQTVRIRKIKSCFILVSRSGFSVPVLVGPNMCERHKLNTELQQQQLSQLTPFHLHLINSFTKFTPRNKKHTRLNGWLWQETRSESVNPGLSFCVCWVFIIIIHRRLDPAAVSQRTDSSNVEIIFYLNNATNRNSILTSYLF